MRCVPTHVILSLLLPAAVGDVLRVRIERTVAVLCVARAPIDLGEELPVQMKRFERIDQIDHLG